MLLVIKVINTGISHQVQINEVINFYALFCVGIYKEDDFMNGFS